MDLHRNIHYKSINVKVKLIDYILNFIKLEESFYKYYKLM